MADYYINRPFCSDDFIRSYETSQKLEKQVIDLIINHTDLIRMFKTQLENNKWKYILLESVSNLMNDTMFFLFNSINSNGRAPAVKSCGVLRLYVPLTPFLCSRCKITMRTFERSFSCMDSNMWIHLFSTFAQKVTERTAKSVWINADRFNHISSMFTNMYSHFILGSCFFKATLVRAFKIGHAYFDRFWWF